MTAGNIVSSVLTSSGSRSRPEMSRLAKNEAFDIQLKLLLIGDSGVGKTCLLLRFVDDKFSPSFITTIGIDFKVKQVKIGDKKVKLQIWDTAGQERFRNITTSYFRGAQAIALVYDVTDRESFENIANWTEQIKLHADEGVSKVLIGNKADMVGKIQVTPEEGADLARKFGIPFFLTSAKTNMNVTEAFLAAAEEVVKKPEPTRKAHKETVDPSEGGGKKKGCCVIM